MRPTRPSDVRDLILRQHADLGASLAELAAVSADLGARGGAHSTADVTRLCKRLFAQLSQHLALEDGVLAPALREADAWGNERADALVRHHQEQRRELTFLMGTDEFDPQQLAPRLAQLLKDLREDMAHEEADILSADLLRDDVVAIAMEDG